MANKPKVKQASQKEKQKLADQAKRQAIANSQNRKKGSTKEYWKGVRQEMSKVVWPTNKELVAYTMVVIFTCVVFALGFWAIDSGFLAILRGVLGITLE